jgi:hypothetical protein
LRDIDDTFTWISAACAEHQQARLEKFKKAFIDYLWARSEFETSVFVFDAMDWTMRQFLDLAPEHLKMLREIGSRQKYTLSQFPVAEQLAGFSGDGAPEDPTN